MVVYRYIIMLLHGPTCKIARFQAELKFPSWTECGKTNSALLELVHVLRLLDTCKTHSMFVPSRQSLFDPASCTYPLNQSTYFGPNFRKWYEFGLICKYQSEFSLNLLRNSDFFNFLSLSLPKNLEKEALA